MLQVVLMFLPAEPVQVLSGISFGLGIGMLCCIVGVILGNTVIFILYKLYGNKLSEYFDKKLDIDFSGSSTVKIITYAIFLLYFLPAIPYGMICFFTATMKLKYPRYIITTTLGAIPSIFIGVGLGHIAMSANLLISLGVFVLLICALIVVMIKKDIIIKKINDLIARKSQKYSSKTDVYLYPKRNLSIPYLISVLAFTGKVKRIYKNNVGKIEHPSIVLCNHGSFIDFAYAGTLLKDHSPNFIVNRMYFYKKLLAKILRKVGCFPKSMFTLDIESAKNCVKVLKNNGVLAMMPEARLSTAGKFEDIQEGTFAFLKKCNVTVYIINIRGDYLAKPKWADKMRRGSVVESTLDVLFTKEEIEQLSVEDIKQRTLSAIYYDEFEWLKTRPNVRYKSRNIAVGLENILSICPRCMKHHTLTTKKNTISCSCGLETNIDDRYSFNSDFQFKNFSQWYEWQCKVFKEQISSDPNFTLSSKVTLHHSSYDGSTMLRQSGEGVCTLDRSGLRYIGTDNGEEIDKLFPLNDIYRILFGAGENFELYEGKEIWYFRPENLKSCVDWYIASSVLKEEEV